MRRYNDLKVARAKGPGAVEFTNEHGVPSSADLELLVIREAWRGGVDFEDLADGFGAGEGTHGDWSAIRDSSDGAVCRMLERALNRMDFRAPGEQVQEGAFAFEVGKHRPPGQWVRPGKAEWPSALDLSMDEDQAVELLCKLTSMLRLKHWPARLFLFGELAKDDGR
jgi:hypothetical protein